MAEIPIVGVPSTYRVPGPYAQILFGQGPSTAAAGTRPVILVMPMLSTGSWTSGTVYRIKDEQTAIDGAGAGSPLHRAARKFLRVNNTAKLYALPVAETSGGSPVKADLTVTWTTDPSASGVTTVWIGDEPCTVAYKSTGTVTTIAAAMAAYINARTHLPVTATSALGVLTITAKLNGASQGDGSTAVIRIRVEIDDGVTTTVATENGGDVDGLGLGTGTTGADGSTTEAANHATALAAIEASRYYYVVTSAWDATTLASVNTHVMTKSQPIPGLRSVAIAGYTGTLANCQTIATGINAERMQIAWQLNSEAEPWVIAANLAAIRQKYEELDPTFNFDSFRTSSEWQITGCYRDADRPDGDDQNDAINDGITPIATDDVGSYIVMSVNTRSKDATGTTDDFRACETHRVSGADQYTDTALLRYKLNYGRKKLMDDEKLSDGTINYNQRFFEGVVRPTLFAPFVDDLCDEFEGTVLQNVAKSKAGKKIVIDPNNAGRLEVGLDLHIVDLLHQATFRFAEVSTG